MNDIVLLYDNKQVVRVTLYQKDIIEHFKYKVLLQDRQNLFPTATLYSKPLKLIEKFLCSGDCVSADGGTTDVTNLRMVGCRAAYTYLLHL